MVQTTSGDAALLDTISLLPTSNMRDLQEAEVPDKVCHICMPDTIHCNMSQDMSSSPDSHMMIMALEFLPQVQPCYSFLDQLT